MSEQGPELRLLPNVELGDLYHNYDTSYAEAQSEQVVDACLRLGLNHNFVPYFRKHLEGLHLVIVNDRNSPAEEIQLGSRLDVQPMVDMSLAEREQAGVSARPKWSRLFIVSETDLEGRAELLKSVIEELEQPAVNQNELLRVSLDWIFAEQSMAALGNTCFMYNTYSRYICDFNGQNENYRAHNTIATEFAKVAQLPEGHIDEDFQRTKNGFGLLMLHESLLTHKIFRKAHLADWTLQKLRLLAGEGAYRNPDIALRFAALRPKESTAKAYDDFFESLVQIDEIDEDDDTENSTEV